MIDTQEWSGWFRLPGKPWKSVSQGTEQQARDGLHEYVRTSKARLCETMVLPKGEHPDKIMERK